MPTVRRRRRGQRKENVNAEANKVGASAAGVEAPYYDNWVTGNTIVSAAITTTTKCMIVVFTLSIISNAAAQTQIQRGGVDKTAETNITALKFGMLNGYGHTQYAAELLDAGTYTYNLVLTGANQGIRGSVIKIVAVS